MNNEENFNNLYQILSSKHSVLKGSVYFLTNNIP